ncbi:hypothetical protein NE237_005712 [Protea cynaroides]|uniref:Uncharacterized protein n=1 Tax=Protea cynaroides TaxID=273540 RepID=A0A9Q0QUM6_9MAGN|nr:hypothetical protein NE237_005712 [Protea cynaroides]
METKLREMKADEVDGEEIEGDEERRRQTKVAEVEGDEAMAIRPLAIGNGFSHSLKVPASEGQAPFTLQMPQSPGSFGFSVFGNSMISYMNQQQQQTQSVFPRTKEEPRDDIFIESLLC